jgi:hypothetical protein
MQNVFIINYNSLYEILDEIKDNLSFKIIKFENEEDFQKNNNLDIKNCLIISKIKPKLLLYLSSISETLGARQQPKLTRSQALYLAKCNSGHRDLSLNF